MQLMGEVLMVGTFVVTLVFMAIYVTRGWANLVGANIMAMAAVILVVSGIGVSRLMWPTMWEAWRDEIRVFMWGAVLVVMGWRLLLLVIAPRPTADEQACTLGHTCPHTAALAAQRATTTGGHDGGRAR